jgi:Protein of unknown function (DUF1524)/Excalibur calcium-binding domain
MTTWPSARSRLAVTAAGAALVAALAGCAPSTSTAPATSSAASATTSTSSPASTPASTAPSAAPSDASSPVSSGASASAGAAAGGAAGGAAAGTAGAPAGGAPGQTAVAVLATLEVKGRAPKTGYSREQFGDGWVDTDRNGCDSRNDVLARDLTAETFKPGTRDCVVASGTLADPYSGKTIAFTRGQDTSSAVQIDHVVALSDAWQKGAQQWDEAKRVAFANDGLELLAVDGPLNGQKSDGDAATWLPPNRTYRCAYVARQVALKATWGLWVTTAERDAIADVLNTCPDQLAPATATAAGTAPGATASAAMPSTAAPMSTAPPTAAPAAPPAAPPASSEPSAPAQDSGVVYANCDAVRAAGAAPIHAGQPGYSRKLDRDGDDIGCE